MFIYNLPNLITHPHHQTKINKKNINLFTLNFLNVYDTINHKNIFLLYLSYYKIPNYYTCTYKY